MKEEQQTGADATEVDKLEAGGAKTNLNATKIWAPAALHEWGKERHEVGKDAANHSINHISAMKNAVNYYVT